MGPREMHQTLPSTQVRAIELARSGADEGTRVVARRQTAGRGRGDHTWVSPPGGLYLSLVAAAPATAGPLLPLGLGANLADAFSARFGLPLRTKWPNDILLADGMRPGRKLAGVIVDRVVRPDRPEACVVGVGVNVRLPPGALRPELAARSASLAEGALRPPPLDEVEAIVVDAIERTLVEVDDPDRSEGLLARCRERLYGVGRNALVDGHPVGRIIGLDPDGALRLAGTEGVLSVLAGELAVEDPA